MCGLLTLKAKLVLILSSMVILSALTIGLTKRTTKMAQELSLRVAYPLATTLAAYDPAARPTAARANLIYSLYSQLVAFNKDGDLVPRAASSFYWNGDALHVTFKPIRTIDGYLVTADDAAFSLKRTILLSTNAHGDLANFLCPDGITAVTEECPGINVVDGELILQTSKAAQAKFLLPLLTASDFVIVPKIAVDVTKPSLPIVDLRNTSGPYYVSKDSLLDGVMELKANPNNFEIGPRSAKVITLVKGVAGEARRLFMSGQVDAITTVDMSSPSELRSLVNSTGGGRLHETGRIQVLNLSFSEHFMRTSTVKERLGIGKVIKEAYLATFGELDGVEQTNQFFPHLGDGSLSVEELSELQVEMNQGIQEGPRSNLLMVTFGKDLAEYQKAFAHIPNLDIEIYRPEHFQRSPEEQPHLLLFPTDASYLESISLISYHIELGTFGLDRKEGAAWLNSYMGIEDKGKRLTMLRELHKRMLTEGRIVPIAVSPYISVTRVPWQPDSNYISAVTRLWEIKHD